MGMNSDSGRVNGLSGRVSLNGWFHGGDGACPVAGWAGCASQLGHRSTCGWRPAEPLRGPHVTGGKEGQAGSARFWPILPRKLEIPL
jgi:hypothetical protein